MKDLIYFFHRIHPGRDATVLIYSCNTEKHYGRSLLHTQIIFTKVVFMQQCTYELLCFFYLEPSFWFQPFLYKQQWSIIVLLCAMCSNGCSEECRLVCYSELWISLRRTGHSPDFCFFLPAILFSKNIVRNTGYFIHSLSIFIIRNAPPPPKKKTKQLQGSHAYGKSWKTMENVKIKFKPGKFMENENLAKSHGKVMEFWFFLNETLIQFCFNLGPPSATLAQH